MNKKAAIDAILAISSKKLSDTEKIVAIKIINEMKDDDNFELMVKNISNKKGLTQEAHKRFLPRLLKNITKFMKEPKYEYDDFDGRGKYLIRKLASVISDPEQNEKYVYIIDLHGVEYKPYYNGKLTKWIIRQNQVEELIKLNMVVSIKKELYVKDYKNFVFDYGKLILKRKTKEFDQGILN